MSEESISLKPAQRVQANRIAQEMAESYRAGVEFHRQNWKVSAEEAVAHFEEPPSEAYIQRILSDPPEQVSWASLRALSQHDPNLAWERWEAILQVAREQLQNGDRAARAITMDKMPVEWAQFLAIREELASEWEPRNGIERNLIDQMATAYSQQLIWTRTLTNWMGMLNEDQPKNGYLRPPRVDYDTAIDRAAGMVDRLNKLFLRCLRNLRDLRRYAPAVIVQNAGQVNVGQQQVNVAQQGPGQPAIVDAPYLPE